MEEDVTDIRTNLTSLFYRDKDFPVLETDYLRRG